MKIKFLILLYILATGAFYAQPQDSVYTVTDTVEAEYYDEAEADEVKFKPLVPAEQPRYTTRKFKEGYKGKYSGRDFNYEEEPVSQSLWSRFLEWLSRVLSGSNDDGSTSAAGIIWYIVAVVIILMVAYFIAWAIMGKESKWIFGRGRRNIEVYDTDAENIHEMDFATLIEQTRREGNYRLAVRYYYLWLLKKLSFREIIEWHTDKTNTDYYYEIKDPALRDDFKYLSYVYDHSWYGEFQIDNSDYAQAERAFQKTLNKL